MARIATTLFALVAALAALLLTAVGCSEHQDCPDHADCPKGATCKCDKQGRLAVEVQDLNGDGKKDSVTHSRDEAGRLVASDTDFNDDGSIERHFDYQLDAQGRRLSRKGWQKRCNNQKFFWECTYEEPCPPPYDKCSRCPNRYTEEKKDGKIEPCGATAAKSARANEK